MTTGINDQVEVELASEVIRNLYLARFTQNVLRCASMSLASSYMDADISGASIRWEDTAAYPLLKLVSELQRIESELVINDTTTLIAYSEFFQRKASELVESTGTLEGMNAKWLPDILMKCRDVATKACLPLVGDKSSGTVTLSGLDEQVADAYASLEIRKLLSLKVQFTIARKFTLKAVEQFVSRAQDIHQNQKATGFSYFENLKEFVPLLHVASAVIGLVADKDITSLETLDGLYIQIRRQFSATDELSHAAQKGCNQLLGLCLREAKNVGTQALGFLSCLDYELQRTS